MPITNALAHQREVESYSLALLTEECGEVLQLIGKAGRFGIDTPGVKDKISGEVNMSITPRTHLNIEVGDMLAAVDYLIDRGILDRDKIMLHRHRKAQRLLNPMSVDNLGRKLAP